MWYAFRNLKWNQSQRGFHGAFRRIKRLVGRTYQLGGHLERCWFYEMMKSLIVRRCCWGNALFHTCFYDRRNGWRRYLLVYTAEVKREGEVSYGRIWKSISKNGTSHRLWEGIAIWYWVDKKDLKSISGGLMLKSFKRPLTCLNYWFYLSWETNRLGPIRD